MGPIKWFVVEWLEDAHLLHKWGPWETVECGDIKRSLSLFGTEKGEQVVGSYVEQRRTCVICGLVQLRTVRTEL